MASKSQTSKTLLLLLGFTLILSTASAAEFQSAEGGELQDNEVWLNDQVNHVEFEVSCTDDQSPSQLVLYDADGDEETSITIDSSEINTGVFHGKDISPGAYQIEALCGEESKGGDEQKEDFNFYKLNASFDQGTYRGYEGHVLGEGESEKPALEKSEVEGGEFDSSRLGVSSEVLDLSGVNENNELNAEVLTNEETRFGAYYEIDQGHYINFSGEGFEDPVLNASEPWSVNGEKASVFEDAYNGIYVNYDELHKMSYIVDLSYLGQPYENTDNDLRGENFRATIEPTEVPDEGDKEQAEEYDEESWFEVESVKSKEGRYNISLKNEPTLGVGEYRFVTNFRFDSFEGQIDSVPVYSRMTFSGQVQDTTGRGVDTNIRFTKEGLTNTVDTGDNGQYNEKILPTVYDSVELEFFSQGRDEPEVEIFADNADITESDGSTRYEYWNEPEMEIEAVNPVNMMAVEFGYPVETPKASMKFDSTGVNPDDLKVFECSQWNFFGKECLGEWNAIDEDDVVITTSWRAEFPVQPYEFAGNSDLGEQEDILMNAYIVGTSADLGLSNKPSVRGPENGRIPTGSEVTVEGRVESENENFVEGADVDVSFYKGDEEISSLETAETDIEGRFTATGKAPEAPGNYSVEITADEVNYNRFEKKFDNSFETFVKEGVAVRTDSPVEVSLGGESETEIIIQNTGQTDMQNVVLEFEGLEADYYSANRTNIDEVPAGEERVVDLTFDLPGDYCGEVCETYPQLDIAATAENSDGETFESETNTLRTQITRTGTEESEDQGNAAPQEESSTTENETNLISGSFSESVTSMENATGEFLASQSTLNIALGLIMIFTMVLAGAVKKKKDEDDGDTGRKRGQRPAIQKPDLGGSKVSKPEPEEQTGEESGDEIDEVIDSIGQEVSGDVDETIDEIAEEAAVSEGETEETGEEEEEIEQEVEDVSSGEFACTVCGEKFDSESGRDLHEQVMHEE